MNFIQQYSRTEGLTGIIQYVRFVVSNNYDELFSSTGIQTDIFLLENIKEDLNIDEGSFAIDELTFSINELACSDASAKNALAFTLEAKDMKVNRYCALFFIGSQSEASTVDKLRYLGKVKDKVDWTDKVWRNPTLYTDTPLAYREYKFSSLSFDVSVLEKCLFNKAIYKTDPSTGSQTKTPNIYDMIAEGGSYRFGVLVRTEVWSATKTYKANEECKVANKYYKYLPEITDVDNPPTCINKEPTANPSLWVDCGEIAIMDLFEIKEAISSPTSFLRPIGNLYNAIKSLYLDKASIILSNVLNSSITFNLKMSSLGVNATQAYLATNTDTAITESQNAMFELKFDSNASNTIYIHRRMIKAALGGYDEEMTAYLQGGFRIIKDPSVRVEFPSPGVEKSYSFESLNNVSDLFFELARALGCYIFAKNTSGSEIELEFRPRQTLLESGLTYIIGAKDAQGNTSVATSNDAQAFYADGTPISVDGVDVVWGSVFSDGTSKEIPSDKFSTNTEARKAAKEKSGLDYKRLILSTSPTIYNVSSGFSATSNRYLCNSVFYHAMANYFYDPLIVEHLTTAIYSSLDGTKYAPVYKIYSKLNGSTIKGSDTQDGCTLSEYVNAIMGHDKSYYETEYEWTVPSWNGFSKSPTGSNPSWQNIKRGSKILIKDRARIYNKTTGLWTEITDPNGIEFVVVGIETNLQNPETKIKLHYTSRFAYTLFYSGKPGETPLSGVKTISFALPVNVKPNINARTMVCAGTIKQGSFVRLNSDGQILQSESKAIYQGSNIGIALQDGIFGDVISIQSAGEVTLPVYNFATSEIGKYIGVRTNTDMNLSANILNVKNVNENLRLIVGKIMSTNSILIEVDELELG